MIVKDEAPVIARCLASVKPFITSWAICDTGSTDGTQGIVRQALAGIPGELVERPWVDFSTNRNEALDLARKSGAEYHLVIDADEELVPDEGFTLQELDADTYSATFQIAGTEARWIRKLLLRASAGLVYRGTMDEYVDDAGKDNRLLENCIVRSYVEGARSRGGLKEKFERDIATLRAAVAREPGEPRNWFYLGQRLGGAERYEEAIEAFEHRYELTGGLQEERAQALLQIAQFKEHLKRPTTEVIAAYERAYVERPQRADALLAIAQVYADAGRWPLAELYARAAARMPRPTESLLVNDAIYAWAATDTLAGILASQGKLQEARELLEKLVALPQCPPDQHRRIRENIALIRKAEGPTAEEAVVQLGPDEVAYVEQAAALKRHGIEAFRKLARAFIQTPSLQALPSPARWAWIALFTIFGRRASVIGAAACFPLMWAVTGRIGCAATVLGAPLLFGLARRRLQDTTVAAATLGALAAAFSGSPTWLGVATLALLGLKEAAVFTVPAIATAWLLGGHDLLTGAAALAAGGLAWASITVALFGRMTLPLLRKAAAGHATPYTLSNQRGAPHRLLVDILLVSPVWAMLAVFGATERPELALTTIALLAAHALAPVRNVRLVLAGDLLVRALGFCAVLPLPMVMGVPLLLLGLAADLYIAHKIRPVYDPTTAALAGELGMTRMSST